MRGYAAIGLHEAKDVNNIGSALRAAGCFGAAFVAVSGLRYKHSKTDTQKAWKHIPLIQTEDLKNVIPNSAVCVGVEIVEQATSIVNYVHPERAFYIFGGEDRTLGPDTLSWCRDVISIPTSYCLNLAAAVNVVLYDRSAKQLRCATARL